jgi:hypothetical protein
MNSFGACPKCRIEALGSDDLIGSDGYIRVRDGTWFVCEHHKLKWRADYWCASWTERPERTATQQRWSDDEVWQAREKMLAQYTPTLSYGDSP